MLKARDREKLAKHMLEEGHAPMKDLLTLSYGEWPLKGLDIDPLVPQDQQVTFKPFWKLRIIHHQKPIPYLKSVVQDVAELFTKKHHGLERAGYALHLLSRPFVWAWKRARHACETLSEAFGVLGRATLSGERVIYINKFLTALAGRSSTMGHEAVHSLQGDNYWRADSIYGAEAAAIWRKQNDTRSGLILNELKAYEERHPQHLLTRAFKKATCIIRPSLEYLETGDETQAFLHEAMAAGYAHWHKMPANKAELWMALSYVGIRPPKKIRDYLESMPRNSSVWDFMPGPPLRLESGKNIRAVSRSLSKEGRSLFWYKTLPALYADLIEMYGDKKGRERFSGLGKNTKAEIQREAFHPKPPPKPKTPPHLKAPKP